MLLLGRIPNSFAACLFQNLVYFSQLGIYQACYLCNHEEAVQREQPSLNASPSSKQMLLKTKEMLPED
jgi:hypothetical protein